MDFKLDVRKNKEVKENEGFQYQALRNVVKEIGENVMEDFEEKFKELKIEGKRGIVMEPLYTEKETYDIGSESEEK